MHGKLEGAQLFGRQKKQSEWKKAGKGQIFHVGCSGKPGILNRGSVLVWDQVRQILGECFE